MKTKSNSGNFPQIPHSPFDRALKYLSFRQRSVKEMYDFLTKKKYSEDEITQTIKRLIELHFLNDNEFARTFIESMQRKGKSKRNIAFELQLKGIKKEKVEEMLEDANDDFKTAYEFINKRIIQFERLDPEEKQKKIINLLRMRGFDWETISRVLKKLSV